MVFFHLHLSRTEEFSVVCGLWSVACGLWFGVWALGSGSVVCVFSCSAGLVHYAGQHQENG